MYISQNLLKRLRLSAKVTILSFVILYLVAGIADTAGFESDFSMAVSGLFLFAGAIAYMFFLFYIGKLANLLFPDEYDIDRVEKVRNAKRLLWDKITSKEYLDWLYSQRWATQSNLNR